MHRTDKYSQHSSIIWSVWLNGWMLVDESSGCGFESSWSHLNFRFRACFEQGLSWHSGNYRVWIQSETRTWHDQNIQSKSHIVYMKLGNMIYHYWFSKLLWQKLWFVDTVIVRDHSPPVGQACRISRTIHAQRNLNLHAQATGKMNEKSSLQKWRLLWQIFFEICDLYLCLTK